MAKRVLAGSMVWRFYDSAKNLVFTANTLTDSGLNTTVSKDAIRGGTGHKLLSNYYYESGLSGNLTDPLFDLNYFAVKFGSNITMGSDIQTVESITTTVINQITVTNTPVAFPGTTQLVGAYKLASEDDNSWKTITFVGSVASVSGLAIGSNVCVRYFTESASAREIVVPTNIIPSILYAVGVADEFKAGVDGGVDTSSSKVGTLQVIIPQAQFDGNGELALTSSGHANTALNFEALANNSNGCTEDGYYAILTETSVAEDPFAHCIALGVADGDIDLSSTYTTETIKVYGFYNDGTSPSLISNSLLTFTSSVVGTATVGSHTGIVTRVASGSSTISVVATAKPSLSTTAVVTSV